MAFGDFTRPILSKTGAEAIHLTSTLTMLLLGMNLASFFVSEVVWRLSLRRSTRAIS
jgi:hypothetical protein